MFQHPENSVVQQSSAILSAEDKHFATNLIPISICTAKGILLSPYKHYIARMLIYKGNDYIIDDLWMFIYICSVFGFYIFLSGSQAWHWRNLPLISIYRWISHGKSTNFPAMFDCQRQFFRMVQKLRRKQLDRCVFFHPSSRKARRPDSS